MIKTKHIVMTTATTLMIFLSGCATTSVPVPAPTPEPEPVVTTPAADVNTSVGALSNKYYNQNIDVSQKGPTFHTGMNDGCSTAKGKYMKSSDLYNNDSEYKEGWFYGRRKCQAHRA
ncbi:hypothetical protein MNB_SV-5-350 [hydrothermal vent metagenome]|uniref:Lipoprotein n=1 Tax=hydrothermal vent metagenome TaxID=652676 RepID=A0A1W1EF52_9ZZZZ